MSKHKRIAHLTSVHPRYDTRIFLKMCRSLAKHYSVSLVVADGLGNEEKDGVRIEDVGLREPRRLARMTRTVKRVYQKAIELDADLYHFHDPELLPIGLKLEKAGKKVVFDSHEDAPKGIYSREYIPVFLRRFVATALQLYETYVSRKLTCVVAATPAIRDGFIEANVSSVDINNYPLLSELVSRPDSPYLEKKRTVCFVGAISIQRGIIPLVRSLTKCKDVSLALVGEFSENSAYALAKSEPGWASVTELGFLDRDQVRDVMASSVAGLVTYLPAPNHIDAQPNKMFEYMSATLPIITSDFPLWREIAEGNNCGICVDPDDPVAIGKAMQFLVDNPDKAEAMGKNGRRAVEEKYNWEKEEQKLFALYRELLK